MIGGGLRVGTRLLCLLLGLMAGFFYAFSFTVMPGLDLMTGTGGGEAMQAINVAVRNPLFFAIFAGTPLLGLLMAAGCLVARRRSAGVLLLLSFLIYLGGVVVLTAAINVPMNRALAVQSLSGAADWLDWSATWTRSNHARTAAALVAMALAVIAACRLCAERDGVAHGPG